MLAESPPAVNAGQISALPAVRPPKTRRIVREARVGYTGRMWHGRGKSVLLVGACLLAAGGVSSCFLDRSAQPLDSCADDAQCPPGHACQSGMCARIQDSGRPDSGPLDSGRPDGGFDAGPADGGETADGGLDAGTRDSGVDASLPLDGGPCVEVAPAAASASPLIGGAIVCGPTAILSRSAGAAGLARSTTPGTLVIDGTDVSACIEADFGTGAFRETISVRARAVAATCGASCIGATCGTGRQAAVFASPDGTTYQAVTVLDVSGAFEDYDLRIDGAVRSVLVCRLAVSSTRDHLEVDFIGACTP